MKPSINSPSTENRNSVVNHPNSNSKTKHYLDDDLSRRELPTSTNAMLSSCIDQTEKLLIRRENNQHEKLPSSSNSLKDRRNNSENDDGQNQNGEEQITASTILSLHRRMLALMEVALANQQHQDERNVDIVKSNPAASPNEQQKQQQQIQINNDQLSFLERSCLEMQESEERIYIEKLSSDFVASAAVDCLHMIMMSAVANHHINATNHNNNFDASNKTDLSHGRKCFDGEYDEQQGDDQIIDVSDPTQYSLPRNHNNNSNNNIDHHGEESNDNDEDDHDEENNSYSSPQRVRSIAGVKHLPNNQTLLLINFLADSDENNYNWVDVDEVKEDDLVQAYLQDRMKEEAEDGDDEEELDTPPNNENLENQLVQRHEKSESIANNNSFDGGMNHHINNVHNESESGASSPMLLKGLLPLGNTASHDGVLGRTEREMLNAELAEINNNKLILSSNGNNSILGHNNCNNHQSDNDLQEQNHQQQQNAYDYMYDDSGVAAKKNIQNNNNKQPSEIAQETNSVEPEHVKRMKDLEERREQLRKMRENAERQLAELYAESNHHGSNGENNKLINQSETVTPSSSATSTVIATTSPPPPTRVTASIDEEDHRHEQTQNNSQHHHQQQQQVQLPLQTPTKTTVAHIPRPPQSPVTIGGGIEKTPKSVSFSLPKNKNKSNNNKSADDDDDDEYNNNQVGDGHQGSDSSNNDSRSDSKKSFSGNSESESGGVDIQFIHSPRNDAAVKLLDKLNADIEAADVERRKRREIRLRPASVD